MNVFSSKPLVKQAEFSVYQVLVCSKKAQAPKPTAQGDKPYALA